MVLPMTPGADSSNEFLAKHLRVTCQHIDRLLGEIEGVLNESSSRTAFPEYVMDITPVQQKTIEDYITRIRARLVQVMEGQGMSSQPGSGLAASAQHCPTHSGYAGSPGCPIFRGALAVNPETGDTFAWTVDGDNTCTPSS